MAHPENPLTARVAVNRIWTWHFGTGLVDTPSNFGVIGSTPSHPELLDWLARRFVADGWSMKAMHRLVMTSATYRQASASRDALPESDPDNRLLSRFPPRRGRGDPRLCALRCGHARHHDGRIAPHRG
jgi:hypothetical protein